LTSQRRRDVMIIVPTGPNKEHSGTPDVVICVDGGAVARLGPLLRHLCVGLVDQAVRIRLLSSNPQIETLSLGPIQSLVHSPIRWPATRRRVERIVEALSSRPPHVVHAVSGQTYGLAQILADEFDVDPVLTVSSVADCEAVANQTGVRPPHVIASSAPLLEMLKRQLRIPAERLILIRPGVLARSEAACFAHEGYLATLLCGSALERERQVETFVEAVALLHDRGREILGFVVGGGQQERPLRKLVRWRRLSSVITFAPQHGQTASVMESADIFVVPAPGDTISVRVLLAMGAGVASVVAPNPVCDYIQDGLTAVVCTEPTSESFADAIERLLIDPASARRIATGGLEYVREHHTVSETAQRTANLYRRVAMSHTTYTINT